jgi:SAM-dependent methyltransferase
MRSITKAETRIDRNLRTYSAKDVVSWYSHRSGLMPAEAKVFERYRDLMSRAHVLDIGVGAGRTTSYLIDNCRRYTGIDYSEQLVELCRSKFPDADISQKDARDLSEIDDETVEFVLFSFNGIDSADLEGRTRILSEMHRVLTPEGIFFFSTHNRNHGSFNEGPWLHSENGVFRNVKTFIKHTPFYFRRIKNRRAEVMNDDFAIINDSAHEYRLMLFYTSPAFLRKQLLSHGFDSITLYDKSGHEREDEDLDDWIYVTCRKAPRPPAG